MCFASLEVKEIPVAELLEAGSPYQIRLATDEDTVERYAALYREYGVDALPPLAVTMVGSGEIVIIDGHHRALAAQRAGLETVKCCRQYFDGGVGSGANCVLEAVRANSHHGLALTRADRTNAARQLLALFPHQPLRKIAEEVGLSKSTIANIKNERKSLSKMDKNEKPESVEKTEPDVHVNADGIPSVRCETCGKVVSPDWADSPESDWMRVCSKRFCCQECRDEFESQAKEAALETAGTEYLAAFDEVPESEPEHEPRTEQSKAPEAPEELKPCPFCGSENVKFVPSAPKVWAKISCRNCCAVVYFMSTISTKKIYEKWNTRR